MRIRDGEGVLGAFLNIPSTALAEIVGLVGFDCLVLDAEHGPLAAADVSALTLAAAARGVPAIVRVPGADSHLAAHALDCGAAGLQFPSVDSAQVAAACVRASRYPPLGSRGVSYYTRAGGYTTFDRGQVQQAGTEGSLVVAQVESPEGVANLDEIAAVEGIDVLFFGPTDYGAEVDARGGGPPVDEAAQAVLGAAAATGAAAGIYAVDAADAIRRLDAGFRYVLTGVVPAMVRSLRDVVQQVAQANQARAAG